MTVLKEANMMRWVNFVDPTFSAPEIEAVSRVLRSGWISNGQEVSALEEALCKLTGKRFAIATSSCTMAQELLWRAISPNRIATAGFTWPSAAATALTNGSKVDYLDIDRDTLCVEAPTVLSRINTTQYDAVCITHYAGNPVDVGAIREVVGEKTLIVEDCAHSPFSRYGESPVGSIGDVSTYSFGPTKMLSGGEGGMLVTDDEGIANSVRLLRDCGAEKTSLVKRRERQYSDRLVVAGTNGKMSELVAAVVNSLLSRSDEIINLREKVSESYDPLLEKWSGLIHPQFVRADSTRVPLFIPIVVDGSQTLRDRVYNELRHRRIEVGMHYSNASRSPAFELAAGRENGLPVTDWISSRIVTLPCHAGVGSDALDRIDRGFAAVLESYS